MSARTKKSSNTRAEMKPMPATDVLNIAGDLVPELDAVTLELLERGKTERVMILAGTEGGRGRRPYAVTEIEFETEKELHQCVRMLRWSDERLRARPDQMILWDWDRSFREGMKISFGVAWYDEDFFERRKNAFKEPAHIGYYAAFGATPDRFKMKHKKIAKESAKR